MSLSIDNPYNAHLRTMINEMDDSPSDVANYPEMIYGGTRPQKMVTPESLAYANPLHDVLTAEKQLSVGYEGGMCGGSLLGDLKKGVKAVKKTATKATKSVEKGVDKVVKSKAAKKVGSVAKKVGKAGATVAFDALEAAAAPAGAALGTAASVALANPELAPIGAAIGAKLAGDAGKKGRKYVKKTTGLGDLGKEKVKRPPSAWLLHVKKHAADNKVSYKQAMKEAKETYKK